MAASLLVICAKRHSFLTYFDVAGDDIEMKYADDTLEQEEVLTVSDPRPAITCLLFI